MLKTAICFLLLLCICSGAVLNDRYHPSSKQFKSSATEKATKGPWDQTDWKALARGELQNAIDVADSLNRNKAKNVIMFIGDGMGISTLSAARLYNSESRNLPKSQMYLTWEKFPHVGLSRTYNVDRSTPDSAGTATAYLCGVKANYETIGVNDQVPFDSCSAIAGNTARSIAKHSIAADKWTGIVTTTRITHASPAGAYAHVANRDWEAFVPTNVPNFDQCDDIAKQLITDPENQKTRVILGGGLRMFLPNNETGMAMGSNGSRTDGRNLINEWIQTRTDNGESYQYVQNKSQFDAVDVTKTDYLFGLFSADHMDYEVDRIKKNPPQQPSLAEMTEKAIRLLSQSPNGYFLFVEGGRIDHSHHEASAFRALNDTIALSDAVQRAVELTNVADTTIVVTADHSHVFTFGGYATFQQSVLDFSDGALTKDDKPFLQLNYGNGPSFPYHRMENSTEVPRKNLTGEDVKDPDFQQDTGIWITSETHGGEDVGIFARGPLSHLIHGNHEQNYISHVMMYASCVGDYTEENHCTGTTTAGSGTLSPFSVLHLVYILMGLFILI